VDSAAARRAIHDNQSWLYWLDFGNGNRFGQAILGYRGSPALPTVVDLFGAELDAVGEDTPSCSVEAALTKQDLFVNAAVAVPGMNLLWDLSDAADLRNTTASSSISPLGNPAHFRSILPHGNDLDTKQTRTRPSAGFFCFWCARVPHCAAGTHRTVSL
jgi:hypothetical protein